VNTLAAWLDEQGYDGDAEAILSPALRPDSAS
jgi:hypothetical protein